MNVKKLDYTAQLFLSRPTSYSDLQSDHAQSDIRERGEVIYKLKQRLAHLAPAQTLTLDGATLSLESGSSLEDALLPGRQLLQRMSEHASFKRLIATLRLSEDAIFEVTAQGEINAKHFNNIIDFANTFKRAPDLEEYLQILIEMAELTGGKISTTDQIDLVQWLAFHSYLIPHNAAEGSRLVEFMETKTPASPELGNYWEMIQAVEGNTATLSATQRSEFRKLISSYLKKQSLLEHLSENIFGGHGPFTRSEAEEVIEKLVSSTVAARWADAYVRDLGWYGAQASQLQSETSRKQIILTSLLLDLHPQVGEQVPRNHVAGFDFYAVEHLEKSLPEIQTDFENHLIKHHRVNKKNVALAAHLLLAEPAPEFLVKDLPATLLLGTPQCVEFCRIVAVQEIISPGSTRSMTYAQLMQLSTLEPMTESRKILDALAAVDPVIDWALLNNIVSPEDVRKSIPDSLKVATDAYARHAKTLAENAETLTRPLPTRRSVALDILEQVARGCTYLENDVLHQSRNRPLEDAYTSLRLSPVELHMSNDLATGDWDLKKGESIYKAFPSLLRNLISPDGEFHRQFNRAYVVHAQAMHTHLKQAFSMLPLPERTRLLKGKVTLFTVRPSVAKLQSITGITANPVAMAFDSVLKVTGRKPTESHKEIDEVKGRYGVVIYCEFDDQVSCYELFTLHGTCRENTELGALIQREKLLNPTARRPGINYSAPVKVQQLPMNIECYTHGVTPGLTGVSSGVIDKLAELSPSPSPARVNGYYQSFYSSEFDRLANFVLKHRPVATYDELVKECWGQTRLEAIREKRDKDLDTLLNVVVPFKSCIEDLNSDDLDRQMQGAAACTLEVAMTILLVVGAIAKIASVTAKGISISAKAGEIALIGGGLVSSVINPLDGVTDLLVKGGKFLRKGWHSSVTAVEGAIYDARKWSRKTPYPALTTEVDPDIIRLGNRQYAQNATDVFQVWGIRHTDEWYALNRLGEPWGPPLRNLKLLPESLFNFFRKPNPIPYTRDYVGKALPIAKDRLDVAIRLLERPGADTRLVIKYLFGTSSDEAVEYFLQSLRKMREEFDAISVANMSFRRRSPDALASIDTEHYQLWLAAEKNGTPVSNGVKKFIKIYPEHLDHFYKKEKFADAKIADVLIHEMSHGTNDTLDLYYARGAKNNMTDVASLVDLARKPDMAKPDFRTIHRANDIHETAHLSLFDQNRNSLPKIVQDNPAFHNAQSNEVAVTLLNQSQTDPAKFLSNMTVIQKTVEKHNTTDSISKLKISLSI